MTRQLLCDWDIMDLIVLRHLWCTIIIKTSYTKEHLDVLVTIQ